MIAGCIPMQTQLAAVCLTDEGDAHCYHVQCKLLPVPRYTINTLSSAQFTAFQNIVTRVESSKSMTPPFSKEFAMW